MNKKGQLGFVSEIISLIAANWKIIVAVIIILYIISRMSSG